jgi:hypothetical protein
MNPAQRNHAIMQALFFIAFITCIFSIALLTSIEAIRNIARQEIETYLEAHK